MRWKSRIGQGRQPVTNRGPKKVQPLNLSELKRSIQNLGHGSKRSRDTGRLHRSHAGKAEVCIYDYIDGNSPMLMRMFHKRLRGYRAMGYESQDTIEPAKTLFELPPYED